LRSHGAFWMKRNKTKEAPAASATHKDESFVMESSIAAYVSASLKPLLHFVTTEFIISKKFCSSGAELVECVIQLLNDRICLHCAKTALNLQLLTQSSLILKLSRTHPLNFIPR
jgi:hypothetical protein